MQLITGLKRMGMINFSDEEKIAIKAKNNEYTYSDINYKIKSFSSLLENSSKVCIISENRPEWIFAFYAAWNMKLIPVPVDYMSSNDDVTFILNDCKPEIIFTSEGKLPDINKVVDQLTYTPVILNFDSIQLPEPESHDYYEVPENNEDTAVIIYTSGTTGSPKGVMLSYNNLLANLNEVCHEVPIITHDREMLMLLPLHHVLPLVGTLIAPLYVGSTIVISPSMQNTDLLETLRNNNVAIFIGVPRLYEIIYNGLKPKIYASLAGRMFFNFFKTFPNKKLAKKIFKKVHDGFGGHLEIMISGGAALSATIGKFFETLGFTVLEGYGMTEAAPMITFNRPGNSRFGSPGQKLNTVAVEIRDNEILAKGPNIMQGYYNRPEETSQVLKDGWLHTGDLGYFDKNGFLYITGRKKEIFVLSNGKNINPVEIEEKLILKSQYVSEAAVHLEKDMLHALIVPNYAELTKHEIIDMVSFFRDNVLAEYNKNASSYKRIMQFTLLKNELPRTRLGKIQRFKLAELIGTPQKQKNKTDEPKTEEYKSIKLFIENQVNTTISPDDHLEFDIALDSLGKLGLVDFIDRSFGVKIEYDKLLSFPSVRKLVEFVTDNKLRHKIEGIEWSSILKEKVHLKLPTAGLMQSLIKNLSKIFFKIYFRFDGDGLKNIPDGPCIIAPNHQSYFDGMFVASLLRSRTMRKTYFYAKKKHVNNAFLRFLARKNNIIVMDIHNELKESIQKLAEVLKMGRKVIIFPEGTRTKDGKVGEFKQMFAILSKELSVPVVPVAINGAFKALPSGKIFPRIFTPVHVHFLQPVYPDTHNYDSLTMRVQSDIHQKVSV